MSINNWNPARRALAVALLSLTGLYTSKPSAIEIGAAAVPFDVSGPNGPINLFAYRGKLIYLDFWASWCAPCKHSFPWMNQMQTRYGAQGLQIIGINVDAKHEDATAFLGGVPADFKIGFDPAGAIATSYGIKGMPSSVLIGADGKVVATHAGFNDADKDDLESMIKRNLPAPANRGG